MFEIQSPKTREGQEKMVSKYLTKYEWFDENDKILYLNLQEAHTQRSLAKRPINWLRNSICSYVETTLSRNCHISGLWIPCIPMDFYFLGIACQFLKQIW